MLATAGTAASSCGRRRATTRRAARPTCPSPAGTSWRTTSERPCAWAYPRRRQRTCMCARSGEPGCPHGLPEASGCCGCIPIAVCAVDALPRRAGAWGGGAGLQGRGGWVRAWRVSCHARAGCTERPAAAGQCLQAARPCYTPAQYAAASLGSAFVGSMRGGRGMAGTAAEPAWRGCFFLFTSPPPNAQA